MRVAYLFQYPSPTIHSPFLLPVEDPYFCMPNTAVASTPHTAASTQSPLLHIHPCLASIDIILPTHSKILLHLFR